MRSFLSLSLSLVPASSGSRCSPASKSRQFTTYTHSNKSLFTTAELKSLCRREKRAGNKAHKYRPALRHRLFSVLWLFVTANVNCYFSLPRVQQAAEIRDRRDNREETGGSFSRVTVTQTVEHPSLSLAAGQSVPGKGMQSHSFSALPRSRHVHQQSSCSCLPMVNQRVLVAHF